MKTLILVDLQNDFMPGGPLEVPNGDSVIPEINKIQHEYDLIVATQDWHPQKHKSFASNYEGKKVFDIIKLQGVDQVLWPDHCVQETSGASFHPDLVMHRVEAIFRKGMETNIDSYSGFYDNAHQKSTGLAGYLREKRADDLYFCGLAADICVYFSMLDAINEGFKVTLLQNSTRPLDTETFPQKLKTLQNRGAKLK